MRRLKILVAGCANPHIPGYLSGFAGSADENIELLAVSDFDDGRLARAKEIMHGQPKVKFYSDWQDMYRHHSDAEAVIIGSDNCDHMEMFRFFSDRRLHIHMMKVISMNHDECREMIERAHKSGIVADSELELRYADQFVYARKLLQSGALGRLKSIYLTNISQSPCNYFPNWGVPELSYGKKVSLFPGASVYRGGAITDHPHPFDLVRYITGREFATVRAMSAPNQREHLAVEDHAALTGHLNDGTIYFINPSYSNMEENVPMRRLIWPKCLECNLKLTGEKGYFSCDYFQRPSFITEPGGLNPNRLIVEGTPKFFDSPGGIITNFYLAVTGQLKRPEVTLEEDFAAIRVMNAAYESIDSGTETVPEEA